VIGPGHGPLTTLAHERRYNPFFAPDRLEAASPPPREPAAKSAASAKGKAPAPKAKAPGAKPERPRGRPAPKRRS
jgi:hypothetical protein